MKKVILKARTKINNIDFKKYLYQKYNIDLGRKKFLRLNFDRNIKGIGEIFLKMN